MTLLPAKIHTLLAEVRASEYFEEPWILSPRIDRTSRIQSLNSQTKTPVQIVGVDLARVGGSLAETPFSTRWSVRPFAATPLSLTSTIVNSHLLWSTPHFTSEVCRNLRALRSPPLVMAIRAFNSLDSSMHFQVSVVSYTLWCPFKTWLKLHLLLEKRNTYEACTMLMSAVHLAK